MCFRTASWCKAEGKKWVYLKLLQKNLRKNMLSELVNLGLTKDARIMSYKDTRGKKTFWCNPLYELNTHYIIVPKWLWLSWRLYSFIFKYTPFMADVFRWRSLRNLTSLVVSYCYFIASVSITFQFDTFVMVNF